MREALAPTRLQAVYDKAAGHYDFLHGLLTARSDQRGRRLLVANAVRAGDRVLDCGAGTGSTGLLAAQAVGNDGRVVMLDASDGMLGIARRKAVQLGMQGRVRTKVGDLQELPFADDSFDAVLSTYSLCPVVDPARGAREMFRVTRPGGRIGIAHSVDPANPVLQALADRHREPGAGISLRSRWAAVRFRSDRRWNNWAAKQLYTRRIGVPLWPFPGVRHGKAGGLTPGDSRREITEQAPRAPCISPSPLMEEGLQRG